MMKFPILMGKCQIDGNQSPPTILLVVNISESSPAIIFSGPGEAPLRVDGTPASTAWHLWWSSHPIFIIWFLGKSPPSQRETSQMIQMGIDREWPVGFTHDFSLQWMDHSDGDNSRFFENDDYQTRSSSMKTHQQLVLDFATSHSISTAAICHHKIWCWDCGLVLSLKKWG